MLVGLLGALEVLDDEGREVVVAGPKLRALLAVLSLQPGRVVPAEQLIDALWGDNPPTEVRNGLQGLASKLRRTLGSPDLVAMRGAGYALELDAGAIDVHRYEEMVVAARAAVADSDLGSAAGLLAEAESLWRGDPLADFTYETFAQGAITRLSELRLTAIEERLDIELQLGRHPAAVAELEELVAAHPLRERLRGLLMLALYRAGRQADALRVVQEGRHLLAEELGLEPGHELRALEAAILAQDRSLDVLPIAARDATRAKTYSIPDALTPLVGRDAELRELTWLAAEHRFVTLVGPGGVGKTRLALEVARAGSAELTFGGCLVELAPVGNPAGVRAAIASALALPDPGRLAEVIGDREMLLVLDNCEHVVTTAAEVAEDLLRRCPALRLLATSREGLRVGGETIWPVPPLAADDAVSLFVARAQAASAPLELSAGNRTVIADICSRLDGLPLAIELAAARTRAFPLQQISARLNDRFRLLTGGSRTALPRQQTLRAVVDWSYELLFDDEQRVFERLSVFPGGCDLATAEAVCADEAVAADDVADLIHALVEKSLVIAVPKGDALRFTQLQTLCHYGRERLTERGDAERVRNAMAKHYAELCGRSAAAYRGDQQRAWLTAIDQEHDNLRAALEWAVANDDAATALTIAGGTSWPHWLAGMVIEGKRWLDDAFGCAGDADERTRALALTGRGLLDFLAGARDTDDDLEAALEIFRRHDDVESIALAYSFYAEQPNARGDRDEARRRRLVVVDFYGESPKDPFAIAARAYSLGKLALLAGDLSEAEVHYRAAAEGFAQIDRPVMLSMSLDVVADFDERAGDYAAAVRGLEEAIATNDACGLRGFTGSLLARLGWALLHEGDVARAETIYARALDGARRLRNTPVVFLALTGTAVLHRRHHRDSAAAAAATEALELYRAGDPRRFKNRIDTKNELRVAAAACYVVLAAAAAESDDPEHAAVLLGRADRLRAEAGADGPAFQRDDLDEARRAAIAAIGADEFTALFERGQLSEVALSP
ncbi:MAG: BTAD domain-containing putative transcriptional regulator [Acidimicrobiales bacterium]